MLNPTTFFLTGATGFLGAFLLRDLLQIADSKVICLVRGADGLARVLQVSYCVFVLGRLFFDRLN